MITVNISCEACTLGEDATQADLDQYAENLAAHLARRFGDSVEVHQVIGSPRGDRLCVREDVAEYVTDLHKEGGWVDLLGECPELVAVLR